MGRRGGAFVFERCVLTIAGTNIAGFDKTFIRERRWRLFMNGMLTMLLITALGILFGTLPGFNPKRRKPADILKGVKTDDQN